jgi:hypothetical protein
MGKGPLEGFSLDNYENFGDKKMEKIISKCSVMELRRILSLI